VGVYVCLCVCVCAKAHTHTCTSAMCQSACVYTHIVCRLIFIADTCLHTYSVQTRAYTHTHMHTPITNNCGKVGWGGEGRYGKKVGKRKSEWRRRWRRRGGGGKDGGKMWDHRVTGERPFVLESDIIENNSHCDVT